MVANIKLNLLVVFLYLQHSRFLTFWPCQKAVSWVSMFMGTGIFQLLLTTFSRVMMMLPRRPEVTNYLQGGIKWNLTSMTASSPTFPLKLRRESSTTSTRWFLSQLMKEKSEYWPFFGAPPHSRSCNHPASEQCMAWKRCKCSKNCKELTQKLSPKLVRQSQIVQSVMQDCQCVLSHLLLAC